jgi:hypothetical protein
VPNFSSRSKYIQNGTLSLKGIAMFLMKKIQMATRAEKRDIIIASSETSSSHQARHHHRIKRDIIIASIERHQSHQARRAIAEREREAHTLV